MKTALNRAVQFMKWRHRPPPLLQLPNGTWINPVYVVEITTTPNLDAQLTHVDDMPAVYINMAHNLSVHVLCDGDDPEATRDEIAGAVGHLMR